MEQDWLLRMSYENLKFAKEGIELCISDVEQNYSNFYAAKVKILNKTIDVNVPKDVVLNDLKSQLSKIEFWIKRYNDNGYK